MLAARRVEQMIGVGSEHQTYSNNTRINYRREFEIYRSEFLARISLDDRQYDTIQCDAINSWCSGFFMSVSVPWCSFFLLHLVAFFPSIYAIAVDGKAE